MNELPERKRLPHGVPHWVNTDDAIFFITVCTKKRNENLLCHTDVEDCIFESIETRVERKLWYPYIFLLMPDHCHFLASFNLRLMPMRKIMQSWKSWVAKKTGIQWQDGFFDHRLRSNESREGKCNYILENPVRAGLVEKWQDWPYIWFPYDWIGQPEGSGRRWIG